MNEQDTDDLGEGGGIPDIYQFWYKFSMPKSTWA